MEFSRRAITNDQVRHGLISALIADSVAVPITLTFAFVHTEPFRTADFLAAVACMVIPAIYVAAVMRARHRRGEITISPVVAFTLIWTGLLAVGFIELASGFPLGLYLPALLLGVVLTSLIGDREVRVVTVALCTGIVAATSWQSGVHGGEFATRLVIYAWVFAAAAWMTSRHISSLHQLIDSRTGLRSLVVAASDTATVAEALATALPLVQTVLPTDHVAVFSHDAAAAPPLSGAMSVTTDAVALFADPALGADPALAATVAAAWPHQEPADLTVPHLPAFQATYADDTVRYVEGRCFVPIGFAGGSKLLLVIDHPLERGETKLLMVETAEQVASTFLALVNRAEHVAGLEQESRTDLLTTLCNRRGLEIALRTEMDRSQRDRRPLALAMVDLDRFKLYNDANGHVAGDALLQSVASLLASSVRSQDLVAGSGARSSAWSCPTPTWAAPMP